MPWAKALCLCVCVCVCVCGGGGGGVEGGGRRLETAETQRWSTQCVRVFGWVLNLAKFRPNRRDWHVSPLPGPLIVSMRT